ncbi:MAG: beta-lactamase family protein [Oscillospiraceae bacterium]|nr:beta-lactamase family protein [Oscillospiraceae bacterium]
MKHTMKAIAAGCAVLLLLAPAMPARAAVTKNKPHETTDTLYSVASVSKIFAVTAVMQLADEGKIDLDAPVTDYLPDFRLADSRYQDITVRMLMNHRSGLMGSCYGDTMFFGDRSERAHINFLEHLSSERLKAAPGAFVCYCNDGFELLSLIAERVSGESFTDYVEKHICVPLDLQQTGTPWNAFETDEQVRVFYQGKSELPAEYDMTVGAGGVLSTAPELSRFGTAFFTGNNVLLSEKSKAEMKRCYEENKAPNGCGLGWDSVGDADYTAAGVQVLSKGGDLVNQHAELYVAPDENTSIAVCSAGGSSSAAKMLAAALMDIALEEKGITVTHSKLEEKETVDTVPAEYLQYEGLYLTGEALVRVTFPDRKYMQVETLTEVRCKRTQYMYTTDGGFVKTEGNIASGRAVQTADRETLYFCELGGEVYIRSEQWFGDDSLGYSKYETYSAQRAEANPLSGSESVQAAWEARSGMPYYLVSGKFSDASFSAQNRMTLIAAEGYVGNWKIIDKNHAQACLHIPSDASRDLTDLECKTENGIEYLYLRDSNYKYIAGNSIPDFTTDLREVQLTTDAAAWYNIGSNAYRTVTLDIPEHASVYVYDKFGQITYSSFMKNRSSTVPLPANGMIVFVGETGGTVGVQQSGG